MAIGKLSFPYINTILKRWAEQGILTIPDAERDHENYRQQSIPGTDSMKSTEGISEIEKQFMAAYNND